MSKGFQEWERYEFGKNRPKFLSRDSRELIFINLRPSQLVIEGVTNGEILALMFGGPEG